jgi:hypothetical protein
MQRRAIIYCLHNLQREGLDAHYIGSCFTDQFRRRIKDHYTGRGTTKTAAALSDGEAWVLVSWIETDDRKAEFHQSTRASLVSQCSFCERSRCHGPPNGAKVAHDW